MTPPNEHTSEGGRDDRGSRTICGTPIQCSSAQVLAAPRPASVEPVVGHDTWRPGGYRGTYASSTGRWRILRLQDAFRAWRLRSAMSQLDRSSRNRKQCSTLVLAASSRQSTTHSELPAGTSLRRRFAPNAHRARPRLIFSPRPAPLAAGCTLPRPVGGGRCLPTPAVDKGSSVPGQKTRPLTHALFSHWSAGGENGSAWSQLPRRLWRPRCRHPLCRRFVGGAVLC